MRKKLTILFIIAGLIGIVASCMWIYDHWETRWEQRVAKAAAADVSADAEEIRPDLSHMIVATRVISHRGYPAQAEEHTITGYDLAVQAGTLYLEQDLVLSADGTVYVSHDFSPGRMTGNYRNFYEMTDEEIDELRTYGGEKIPKLSDVFERYGKSVCYVTELKDNSAATIQAYSDVVREYGMETDVIIQSQQALALEALEREFPDAPKMLVCKTQEALDAGLGIDYVDIFSIKYDILSEGNVTAIHERGKQVSVWTPETEDEILRTIELGADSYFTDDTGLAMEIEERLINSNGAEQETDQ